MATALSYGVQRNFQNQWLKNQAFNFTRANFEKLLNNQIPSIKIDNFLSPQKCSFITSLAIKELSYYKDIEPRVGRIGVTQFEFTEKGDMKRYFEEILKETPKKERIQKLTGFYSEITMIKLLSSIGINLKIASQPKFGQYYTGLYRFFDPNGGAYIHFDYAPYDGRNGWSIRKVKNQISFNIYLKVPEIGGELFVYNNLWESGKFDSFLNPPTKANYGYTEKAVENSEMHKIIPKNGDLFFFNSQNLHEVKPGNEFRFTISSFIGQTENDEFVMWN